MSNSELALRGKSAFMQTYGSFPIAFEKGDGCYLYDVEGKKYLDCVAGIAVNALGYNNEKVNNTIEGVIKSGILHTSNLYYNDYAISAAEKLKALSNAEEVFFCNSGAEANEAAIKLARLYGSKKNKSKIISMHHSFHGRTYGAITLTGQEKYHKGFYPLMSEIYYATFNDISSVENLCDDKTCAIIVELIQGEGGIIKAEESFIASLRSLCDEKDILLIFDCVQCGMGRTGRAFAFEHYNVKPDIMTLAKALGCGFPIGACVGFEKVKGVFTPGSHASTFGGNYISCALSNVILDELIKKDLLLNVEKSGEALKQRLIELVKKYPTKCTEVRGIGLMQGLVLTIPVKDVVQAAISKGLLVCSAGYDVLRFVPPLIITIDEINKAIDIVDEVLSQFE